MHGTAWHEKMTAWKKMAEWKTMADWRKTTRHGTGQMTALPIQGAAGAEAGGSYL